MGKLKLVLYGNPVLKLSANKIQNIDAGTEDLATSMIEVMDKHAGMGLAAPQVGIAKRLILVRLSDEEEPIVLVNPEITFRDGMQESEEGCLSVPGVVTPLKRAQRIRVSGTTLDGKRRELEFEGLAARAFQHEIDHIDGILITDRMGKKQLKTFTDQLKAIEQGDAPPVVEEKLSSNPDALRTG